ncbi:MAG: hypothetical protein JRJ84_01380 [Deltaproteobacteria bacterium]|nr:hypothetical protein [Deltaproteobacteria bacterium]
MTFDASGSAMVRAALWSTVLLLGLFGPATAGAQSAFTLDSILVVPPQTPDDATLASMGLALQTSLETMLAAEYLIVPFDAVPDYQDYSAGVYLESCPDGEYVGCAWVMGSRGNAEWVVGMEMVAGMFGDPEVLLTIVDVEASRAVVSFSSSVEEGNHGAIAAGLSLVLDSVIRGSLADEDVRGEVEDPREVWERRRAQAREAAQDLAFAEQGLQILVRPEVSEFDEPRLTVGDLSEYEHRDDDAPWVRMSMRKGEYVRYKNSGKSLESWQQLTAGRKGQLTLYLEGGVGSGSYRLAYDARWVLGWVPENEALEAIETSAIQQMEGGPSTRFGLEAAWGFHPLFEAGVGIASRTQRFKYFYQREIEGEELPQLIADSGDEGTFRYTPEIRVRASFIPFPTFMVRPTGSLALAYWKGSTIDRVVLVEGPVEVLPAPQYLMLHVAPGIEASPNNVIALYARFNAEILLGGKRTWEEHAGDPVLQEPADTNPLKMGGGYAVTFGLAIRLGPFFGSKAPARVPTGDW